MRSHTTRLLPAAVLVLASSFVPSRVFAAALFDASPTGNLVHGVVEAH